MTEKRISHSNAPISSPESQESVGLDLSPLTDARNFRETIRFLNRAREQFTASGWKGGLAGADGPFSFTEVGSILTDVHRQEISSSLLSANERLAIVEAFQFAGLRMPSDDLLEKLREEAEGEIIRSAAAPAAIELIRSIAKDRKKTHLPKRVLGLALALVLIGGGAAAAGISSERNQGALGGTQAEAAEVSGQDGRSEEQEPSGLASIIGSVQNVIASAVSETPRVEDINFLRETPYHLWGIDWSDHEEGIAVTWDAPEIVERNGGQAPQIVFFPIAYTEGTRFGSACPTSSGLDCVRALDGYILVGGHTSHDFSMEGFRHFIEGWSPAGDPYLPAEERAFRETLLEEYRPTVTYRDQAVQPQAVVLRIPPRATDLVYEFWQAGNEATMEIALEVDPSLGSKINLERPFVVAAGCGRRLSGDIPSQSNQPDYQAAVYLLILGEAVTSP